MEGDDTIEVEDSCSSSASRMLEYVLPWKVRYSWTLSTESLLP